MAQKKITDLQLRSSVIDTLNIPADDTIQTYRITIAQILDFVRKNFQEVSSVSSGPYSSTTGEIILANASGGAFTINLPTASAGNTGAQVEVMKVSADTSGNLITISGTGVSVVLSEPQERARFICDGTNWIQLP